MTRPECCCYFRCSIFKYWSFASHCVITINHIYFFDEIKTWLSGFHWVLLINFYSAEYIRWIVVFHVNIICFERINEIRHLNSWFHWWSTFLEIWSSSHSRLWLEGVFLWWLKHVILHWSSWSMEYILCLIIRLIKVVGVLLLWGLELLLLCLLPVVHILVLKSIHIILAWFSLLIHQWEKFSILSLYNLSHCLIQEVVGRIDWLLGTLISAPAGWFSFTIELSIYGIYRWKIISHWVFISNNNVILVIWLFKSTGVWLSWHLSKMRLLRLINWWVLLSTEVWGWDWIIIRLMWDWLWIYLNNDVLHMIICYVVSGIMILVKVVICIFDIINNLGRCSLELIIEGVKGVLLLLRLLVILLFKLL